MGVSRRKFGSLVPRLGADGLVRSYLAEYTYHGRTVRRTFRDEADASSWLSGERRAVDLDRAGVEPWAPPDARDAMGPDGNGSASGGDVLFVDYADAWAANLRSRNGGELRGSSRRRVLYIVSLLKEGFPAPLRLADLDPGVIRDWYEHRRPESDWSFRECCVRLNAMLRDASDPDRDGGPLIDRNPYRMPVPPKPDIDSHDAPPITPQQLKGLYEAFPDYTRLSVLLVCLAGGMRTGEVCALRVGDIDLDGGTLRVSHSVSRGADDRGELRLGPTKTPGSHRTVPIPSSLIPLIRAHIDAHCGNDPDSPLFVAKRGKRISQRTLDHQMDVARKQAGRPDLTFRMLRAALDHVHGRGRHAARGHGAAWPPFRQGRGRKLPADRARTPAQHRRPGRRPDARTRRQPRRCRAVRRVGKLSNVRQRADGPVACIARRCGRPCRPRRGAGLVPAAGTA